MATETYERAIGVAKGVLGKVRPDQLDDPTPCASWKVRDVINHLVGGSHFFASATEAGEVVPGDDPPDFSTGDYVKSFDEATARSVAAFNAPGAQEKIISLPFGKFPGAGFMGLATTDTMTHAWDLAKATGQPTDLDPELSAQLHEGAKRVIQPAFRGPDQQSPFGPEQQAPEGASAADQLAAFLGRTV